MKKIFLSFSFQDSDRILSNQVEQLVDSHNLTRVTGERAGGEPLRDRIFEQIRKCDGLIALLTRRDQLADGAGWKPSEWVVNELNHARTNGLRTIALVEDGVVVSGAFTDHERIHFKREELVDAILSLSATLGLWQREAGRRVKVRIMPETLSRAPRFVRGQMGLEYRYLIDGEPTDWKPITPIPEVGSTVVYLPGVQDGHLIQLQVRDGPNEWQSNFVHQSLEVELNQVSGGAQ